jgi:ribose transport system ATP-binding protein
VEVLRDGKNAGSLQRSQVNHANLVRLMVGRDLQQFFQKQRPAIAPATPPRLVVRDLTFQGGPATGVSFELRPGEIVGMAGLVGAGRTELAEALFGIRKHLSGAVILDGSPLRIHHPKEAIAAGLVLAPEDRRYHGLILEDAIRSNISLPSLDRLSYLRMVDSRREEALAQEMSRALAVKTPSIGQKVGLLSGGNQQKVVLSKWLARRPRVLILDEPTRGIDVGAKSEIYALMDRLAAEGMAILMISSDLEEVLNVSDRVLVMHEGRLAGVLAPPHITEETVMNLATGGKGSS